jgi:hypothetical protein
LFTGAVALAGVAAFTDGTFRQAGSITGIGLFGVWVAVWRSGGRGGGVV